MFFYVKQIVQLFGTIDDKILLLPNYHLGLPYNDASFMKFNQHQRTPTSMNNTNIKPITNGKIYIQQTPNLHHYNYILLDYLTSFIDYLRKYLYI